MKCHLSLDTGFFVFVFFNCRSDIVEVVAVSRSTLLIVFRYFVINVLDKSRSFCVIRALQFCFVFVCVCARSWLLLCFTSSFIKFIALPQYSAGVKAERRFIRGHDLCVTPSQRYQQALGFSSPGSPAGEASASGIRSLISPSCLRFLIEYLQYQPLYGWSHAAVLWLPFLTLTTCLVSAESVTHTQSPSYISTSVFVQLHTSSIWLHLAVLIHGFSDKGNTGRGQISPGWRCSFLREGTARVGL